MCCDKKKFNGIGSLSNNGKQDPTLNSVSMFPKKPIIISKAACLLIPELPSEIKELKMLFSQEGHSINFGMQKNYIFQKLRNSKTVWYNRIIDSIDILRINYISENTKISEQLSRAMSKRLEIQLPSVVQPGFISDVKLNHPNHFSDDEVIRDFKRLLKFSSIENNLSVLELVEQALTFVTVGSDLKIRQRRSNEELIELLKKTTNPEQKYGYGVIESTDRLLKDDLDIYALKIFESDLSIDFAINRKIRQKMYETREFDLNDLPILKA